MRHLVFDTHITVM